MTRKSAPWIGLGFVLLLGAAAGCIWFSGKAEEAKKNNQLLVANQAALTREIVVLRRQLAEAESRAPDADKAVRTVQATPKKAESKAWQDWQRRYSGFNHKSLMRSTWYRFHDVVAKLNLPPDKQVQLLDLMTTKWEATIDARDAANSQGITDPKEIDAASKLAADDVDAEIAALIGQQKLDELAHGQDLTVQKSGIERTFGTDLQMGGVPLSPDQEAAMAEVYLDNSKPSTFSEPSPAANLAHQQQTDAATLEKASLILNPEQMSILRDYLSWNEERAKVLADQPK
jgi:hypothetical protein